MKGMGGHQSAIMRSDEWLTPPEILINLGEFDLDPCAPLTRPWDTAKVHYTLEDDGLMKEWFGRVWLNPPYGRELEKWMAKMADHQIGIALIFARTDTYAFHRYVFPIADSLLFVQRRISFCTVGGLKAKYDGGAPSVLIAYGEENSEALMRSGIKGYHVPVNYTPMIVVGVSATWFSIIRIAVRQVGDEELKPVYDMVERLAPDKVANNQHWKAKVRQQIQVWRRKRSKEILIEAI